MPTVDDRLANLSAAKLELLAQKRRLAAGKEQGAIRRRADRGTAPLSFAQQRLWVVQQLDPESYHYNVPRCLRFEGPLDIDALERGINEIVRRHEVLRTTFPSVGGEPVQSIAATMHVPLAISEITATVADPEAEAVRLALEEYKRPFDLAHGPMLRANLWRLREDDHVLLIALHHIVSDAWTAGILFQELGVLYQAFASSQPSPLEDLPVQYADYAVWQREQLSGERLKQEVAHWEQRLAGAPPLLKLPTDRPRSATGEVHGALEAVALPAELVGSVVELARSEGATLFMTLLAAFSVLMSRYAATTDLVLGTDLANRTQLETEKLIGFFVNLLPVRLRPAEGMTFRALIGQAKEAALDVYSRQDFPFDKIVEALQPERAPNYHPLVQVLFVMQNIRRILPIMAGLRVSEFEVPIIASKFDLAVFMEEKAGAMTGYWLYSTGLFDRSTILKMSRHFENLIRAAVEQPDARLSSLKMLSGEEQAQAEVAAGNARSARTRKLMMTRPEAVRLTPAHEGN